MKCLECKKEISDKAKYCSDKCRMAYTRRTKNGDLPEQTQPEQTRTGLTRTDRMFEDAQPGYYTFGEKTREEKCLECGKKFTTSLRMLRECSPRCMAALLNSLTV